LIFFILRHVRLLALPPNSEFLTDSRSFAVKP